MKTPYYLIDEAALEHNLKMLAGVRRAAGVKILLAQKCYSVWSTYPLLAKYLDGTTASGANELRLAAEEMPRGERHVFEPAFTDESFRAALRYADHVVFNTPAQVLRFADRARRKGLARALRVNIGYSEIRQAIYNPCRPESRLGVPAAFVTDEVLSRIDGLLFHALCEQDADVLERTLAVFERQFASVLPRLTWVNFGGGHLIAAPGYDRARLVRILKDFRRPWPNLTVYLEPGEGVVYNAGSLVTSVLEVGDYGEPFAILDASTACHMPDVLEMPYRPPLKGAGLPGEKRHTYRLGGPTCLAGDTAGVFSFARPLKAGDRLEFGNMAAYTMVKNTHFNGMKLPDIVLRTKTGRLRTLRAFGYADFKSHLG